MRGTRKTSTRGLLTVRSGLVAVVTITSASLPTLQVSVGLAAGLTELPVPLSLKGESPVPGDGVPLSLREHDMWTSDWVMDGGAATDVGMTLGDVAITTIDGYYCELTGTEILTTIGIKRRKSRGKLRLVEVGKR